MRRRLPLGPALAACLLVGMAGERPPSSLLEPVEAAVEVFDEPEPAGLELVATVLEDRAPGWALELRDEVAFAIAEEAEQAGLDPLLVLALIQVESEFATEAVSTMGALGLMQLRPATARWVAQREGVALAPGALELDPSLNVRLGVRYLRYLLQSFRGRLDLALMAYNAGPNRLRGALKTKTADEWSGYVRAVRREYAALQATHGETGAWTLAAREPVGVTP